jgi:hypothetical protein
MINIIDDLLPIELADTIYDHCNKLQWSYNWPSNKKLSPYYHWNSSIGNTSTHNTLDISTTILKPITDVWNYLEKNYLPQHRLIRCYANSYTYGTEGYPHKDSVREEDVTTILYITKEWLREWGGETVVYNGNNILQSSLPAFNRALMINSNIWHCARGVTRIYTGLRTVLVFKSTPNNSDLTRDKLQVFLQDLGAEKLPHNDSNLLCHLLQTYDILKAAKQPEHICLAGGLHSIFGTTIYKHSCLDNNYSNLVVDFAGNEAVQLIKLFSTISRPAVLEEYLQQTTKNQQFDELCLIEAANLVQQNGLKRYPKLQELWNRVFKPCLRQ